MQRIKYIDILRAIAIFLIVFGHAIVHSLNSHIIFNIVYSFHVPLFFMISGFTFNNTGKEFKKFFKNKFFRIVVPYFIWALLFLIPYYLFGRDVKENLGNTGSFDLLENIYNVFYGVGAFSRLKQNTPLWFLPALFTMEIIFYIIFKIKDKIKYKYRDVLILIILFTLSCISYKFNTLIFPFGINTLLNLGFFFYFGYIIRNYSLIEKIYHKKICLIFLSIIGILAGVLNDNVSCVDYFYGNILLFYISSISLSLVIFSIARRISKSDILEYIGKNTMGILIFHKLIIVVFQNKIPIISKYLINSNWLVEMVISVIISVITIIICLGIDKVIKKLKLKALLGEK